MNAIQELAKTYAQLPADKQEFLDDMVFGLLKMAKKLLALCIPKNTMDNQTPLNLLDYTPHDERLAGFINDLKKYTDPIHANKKKLLRKHCLSDSNLYTLMQSELKTTLGEICKKIAVEKAKESLITHYSLPISTIGKMHGFKNHPHFTQVFKLHVGKTPLQYRKCSNINT